ncbi:MAG TPA: alpha/beta fold hydrolase [Pyrinomonadaceae bacterium]|nr:alpha/beta fold hydrolase [Pyrinomonadaceae bacterium]
MNNYPIILAHGIARFDFLVQHWAKILNSHGISLGLAGDGLNYFKGIARHLRTHGFDVFQTSVGFASSVEERAADLKKEIELGLELRRNLTEKVHIIAHSMGGLDARHMIVGHGMADKVASLTTIGTPHLGTSFADWGIENEGDQLIEVLRGIIDLNGFADLTTAACDTFNKSAEAAEAANPVVYRTYAASEEEDHIFAPLQGAWRIINDAEGENDGLVPVKSQMWRSELIGEGIPPKTVHQHIFPVPADHLNEIGWWEINQMSRRKLFDFDLFRSVKNYEDSIKDVYLKIARDVQELPA